MLALLLVSAASVTARAAAAVEPSPGVSNVVFMLIKGIPSKHEITQMVLRQACIDSALGGGHAAVDSVIFHEKPIPEASKKALMAALPSIKLVDARSYGGFQPSTFNMSILTDNDYSLGYRQMVRLSPRHPACDTPQEPLCYSSPRAHCLSIMC